MAKVEESAPSDAAPKSGGIKGWLVMGAVGLLAGATGFAVPLVFLGGDLPKGMSKGSTASESQAADGGSTSQGGSMSDSKAASSKRESMTNYPAFVPFGEVVVNLAEERLTRYLRVTLSLQVDPMHEEMVKKAVEAKKTILKNWLIGYLSDKELDEVRGAVGVNRARREIQEQFNRMLFPEGSDLIQEVLFEEFTVT